MKKRIKILRPTELIRALKKAGFVQKRQTGSHVILAKPGQRSISVPVHSKTLKRPLQAAILKQASLTEEEILSFL